MRWNWRLMLDQLQVRSDPLIEIRPAIQHSFAQLAEHRSAADHTPSL
jgi:hypothetical protein